MKSKSLVAMILLAGASAGPALAEQQIATVRVTATPIVALEMSCASPVAPSRADVDRLLRINDGSQTHALGNRLVQAVGEACNAGVARIEVRRAASGQSLTWAPLPEQMPAVAIN